MVIEIAGLFPVSVVSSPATGAGVWLAESKENPGFA